MPSNNKTEHLGLNKWEPNEYVKRQDFVDDNEEIDKAFKELEDSKVDKVDGKGLSSNDYTNTDKNKLAAIQSGANNYTHPSSHPASVISEDSTRRFVTDNEKSDWNNKVDKIVGKGLSTNDYTNLEKSKLAGIESGANNYTHPSSHPASTISEDSSHRFVTDSEKSNWNNKVDRVSGKSLSTNDYTNAEKSKLAGIETGANNYTHPSSHSATMITGLASVAKSGNYNDLSNKPTSLPANGGNSSTVGGKDFRWEWGSGAPTHIWGSTGSSTKQQVFQPSNISVGYATSAGNADTVDGVHASNFIRSDTADVKTAGSLTFNDAVSCNFGNSGDFGIYHDGVNNIIRSYKHGSNIYIQGEDGGGTNRNIIVADPDAGIDFFYNGASKFYVGSDGVNTGGRYYVNNEPQPKTTVSSTAPSSPRTNDIWIEI